MQAAVIFQQLFDADSSTYTYLLGDTAAGLAVLIDPVLGAVDSYLDRLGELGLRLVYVVDTHAHADHLSAAGCLRKRTGAKIAMGAAAGAAGLDLALEDGEWLIVGHTRLEVRATPGHTEGCISLVWWRERDVFVFSGDALLIGGSGRTDFQGGDAPTLFHSVHDRLFSLPESTIVYPGHDYHGRKSSTIAAEKHDNPRLGEGASEESFVATMRALDLPKPRLIDVAVPANLALRCQAGARRGLQTEGAR